MPRIKKLYKNRKTETFLNSKESRSQDTVADGTRDRDGKIPKEESRRSTLSVWAYTNIASRFMLDCPLVDRHRLPDINSPYEFFQLDAKIIFEFLVNGERRLGFQRSWCVRWNVVGMIGAGKERCEEEEGGRMEGWRDFFDMKEKWYPVYLVLACWFAAYSLSTLG